MVDTSEASVPLSRRSPLATLALAVLATELVGALGTLLAGDGVTVWYPALTKPEFTPPDWVFGPVWVTLFALMGGAVWLIWRVGLDDGAVRLALAFFVAQLSLNVTWSGAFFGLRSPAFGLAVITVLWLAIAATMWAFDRVDRRAALLLAPYLVWVSFAAFLNYRLWQLN